MNARFRQYAKAGLTTAVTGILVAGSGLGFAQSGLLSTDAAHTPPTTSQRLPPGRGATLATGRATPPAKGTVEKPPLGLLQRSFGNLSGKSAQPATPPRVPQGLAAAPKSLTSPAPAPVSAVQTADNTQDESAARGSSSIQATSGIQSGAGNSYPSPTGAVAPKTPVERKLEELYRRDGRTPPPMNIKELPNASTPKSPSQPQVAPTTASKPNLLQRMFPSLSKSSTPPASKPLPRTAPSVAGPRQAGPVAPGSSAAPQTRPQPQVVRSIPQGATSTQVAAQESPGLFPGATNAVSTARMQEPVQLPLADEAEVDAVKGGQDWEDLSLDDSASRATRVASNDKGAPGAGPSPFSGLTLAPEESELNVIIAEPAANTATPEPDEDDFFAPRKPVAAAPVAPPAALEVAPQVALPAAPLAPPAVTPSAVTPPAVTPPAVTPPVVTPPVQVSKMPTLALPAEEKGLKAIPVDSEPKLEVVKDGTAHPEPKLSAVPLTPPPQLDDRAQQLAALAARPHQRGLKGFCPVTLYHKRQLVEAKPQFYAIHQNKMYTFADAEAQASFEHSPEKYIPVLNGKDIVRVAAGEQDNEGSLDHAVWYKGRLYLFASVESRLSFVNNVHQYVPKK